MKNVNGRLMRPGRFSRGSRQRGGWRGPTLVLLLAVSAGIALLVPDAEPTSGSAVVIDGDSLRVGGVEIRLQGIDAPEYRQTCEADGRTYACGVASRAALAGLVEGKTVTCRPRGTDRYRRMLARCTVDGRDIGEALVGQGAALASGDYEQAEAQARAARRGLWSGSFERPRHWRDRHPRPS